MKQSNQVLITGFALFSMCFGAGNLILPPFLGFKSGESWFLVVLGFFLTAVLVPVLAVFTHAKIQGNLADFGRKVSPKFGVFYALIMYFVAIILPTPRTAAVTHEIAIAPFFETSSLWTSAIYFALVLLFALNRSTVLDALGKYLTPLIVLILSAIIGIALVNAPGGEVAGTYSNPFITGILEGYQTFDAIGGAVAGGVLIISLKLGGVQNKQLHSVIFKAALIAGGALLLIYGGLIYSGTLFSGTFAEDANNVEVLLGLSNQTLGSLGHAGLSVLVALACFTTAVAIVTGTSDYLKELSGGSDKVYKWTAVICAILGVAIGQFDVALILDIGIPAINFIYPLTIVLVILNLVPDRLASAFVFRGVTAVVFLFSLPDVIGYFGIGGSINLVLSYLPFSNEGLGWLLPGILTFGILNVYMLNKKSPQ